MSWAEAKWIVDSLRQSVGWAPSDMLEFTAESINATTISLRLRTPEDTIINGSLMCAVAGVRVCRSTTGYPTTPYEGDPTDIAMEAGSFINLQQSGLTEDVEYYYTAFPFSDRGVYNTSAHSVNRASASPGAKVYGIRRNITSTSPEWVRTHSAAGLNAMASRGDVAGYSSFDNILPWSGIQRETLSTGDVMVKIPKFYYKRYREDDFEYIQIAAAAKPGFKVHPLFNHGDVEKDYAYVGAYNTSSGAKSVKSVAPEVSKTMLKFRTEAEAKGAGWGLMDIAAVSAIQMLIQVEYATNDVQTAIGRGRSHMDSKVATGTCDTVINLTGITSSSDGTQGVVWRGIENFWSNVWEWVDGIWVNAGDWYVSNNPDDYDSYELSKYKRLGMYVNAGYNQKYITRTHLDAIYDHIQIPVAYQPEEGSSSTYYCDAWWTGSTTDMLHLAHGGDWQGAFADGLFACEMRYNDVTARDNIGARLLYIPQ